MLHARTLALATTAALLACSPTSNPAADDAANTAAARAAIDSINANWSRLTSSGHADSIAFYYREEGVLLPPNMGAVRGRDSIKSFFGSMNTMSSPPPTLAITAETVIVHGPQAVEIGHWRFAWAPQAQRPAGVPAVDSGKYMARWVNEGGKWQMAEDIWNASTPMPAPAPPPQRRQR